MKEGLVEDRQALNAMWLRAHNPLSLFVKILRGWIGFILQIKFPTAQVDGLQIVHGRLSIAFNIRIAALNSFVVSKVCGSRAS